MLVFNEFRNDARVLKEARTLAAAGYRVRVIALQGKGLPEREHVHGFEVIRVPRVVFGQRARRYIQMRLRFAHRYVRWQDAVGRWWARRQRAILRRLSFAALKRGPRAPRQAAPPQRLHPVAVLTTYLERVVRRAAEAPLIFAQHVARPLRTPLLMRSFAATAREAVGDDRADVYHAHDTNTLPAAAKLARRHRAKLVFDSHELWLDRNLLVPMTGLDRWYWRRIERTLMPRCDATLTVNQSIAEELARRYAIPVPMVVMNTPERIASVTEEDRRLLREAVPEVGSRRLLLYTGAITFNRGLEAVIQAMAQLPDCHLVLMGYGRDDFKATLRAVAERVGVADRVSMFGPVPSDDVTRYASGADLGVAPIRNACLSYYMCSPNKLFEYLTAGLPVIASAFPEMRRVVEVHAIGALFDPEDPADIARAAREVLDAPERAQEMRRRAREATRNYSWEIEGRKLLDLYDRLGAAHVGA